MLPLYSALVGTSTYVVRDGVGSVRSGGAAVRVSRGRGGTMADAFVVVVRGTGSAVFDRLPCLRRYQKNAPMKDKSAMNATTVAPAITPTFCP